MGEAKRRAEAREAWLAAGDHRLGDAPVDEEYYKMMRGVVEALDEVFNAGAKGEKKTTGFVLLVFPYGDKSGRCNFMSNGADRRDIVSMFKEMIARFEGQAEPPTGHA